MKHSTALIRLNQWDNNNRFVFNTAELTKIFHEDSPRTLKAGLKRLVGREILLRPVRGVYLYALSRNSDSNILEQIARVLRRGEYNYVSLESALSEYGAISQIPLDRLTVMTTGRSGQYSTTFGMIEFTHTKRRPPKILQGIHDIGRPLKIATRTTAWRDLKRVGRNTHLVDESELTTDDWTS